MKKRILIAGDNDIRIAHLGADGRISIEEKPKDRDELGWILDSIKGSVFGVLIARRDVEIEIGHQVDAGFFKRKRQIEVIERKARNAKIPMVRVERTQALSDKKQLFYSITKVPTSPVLSMISDVLSSIEDKSLYLGASSAERILSILANDALKKRQKHDVTVVLARRSATEITQVYMVDDLPVMARTSEVFKEGELDEKQFALEIEMSVRYIQSSEWHRGLVERHDGVASDIHLVGIGSVGRDHLSVARDAIADIWSGSVHINYGVGETLCSEDCICCLDVICAAHMASHIYPGSRVIQFQDDRSRSTESVLTMRLVLAGLFAAGMIGGGWHAGALLGDRNAKEDALALIKGNYNHLVEYKRNISSRIQTPFDARDLKSIVEFSGEVGKQIGMADLTRIWRGVANVIARPQWRDFNLVEMSAQRDKPTRTVSVSRLAGFEATIEMTDVGWTYQQNMARISEFIRQLNDMPGYGDVVISRSPVNIYPESIQRLDERMLKPEKIVFGIRGRVNLSDEGLAGTGALDLVPPMKKAPNEKAEGGMAVKENGR